MSRGNAKINDKHAKSRLYTSLLFYYAKQPTPKTRPNQQNGFSLLELVTSLAILSIISTISLVGINGKGGILSWGTRAKIDEAKALLNAAAADCLQKSRINDADTKDTIDDEILSNKRLNTIGYKIDPDADKCSYLQLLPTNEDDDTRYPIGFSVADGKLSKFANPTSDDQASISSCENWAGINCKQDESLKELIAWKQTIAAAEKTCEDNYVNWLKNGTSPYKSNRWNPNADSGCPSRPPKDGSTAYKTSNTCTPSGCNRTVYGLDGEFAGFTKESYDKKLEEKYGKLCTEWAAQKRKEKYTNNPLDQPVKQSPECGEREFWFAEGEDQGSKEGLKARLDEIESEKCELKQKEKRDTGWNGILEGTPGAPGKCGEKRYMCNKLFRTENEYYIFCDPPPPKQCKTTLMTPDPLCLEYELQPRKIAECDYRPMSARGHINDCRRPGAGKPSDTGGWDIFPACAAWARCMKLDH